MATGVLDLEQGVIYLASFPDPHQPVSIPFERGETWLAVHLDGVCPSGAVQKIERNSSFSARAAKSNHWYHYTPEWGNTAYSGVVDDCLRLTASGDQHTMLTVCMQHIDTWSDDIGQRSIQ